MDYGTRDHVLIKRQLLIAVLKLQVSCGKMTLAVESRDIRKILYMFCLNFSKSDSCSFIGIYVLNLLFVFVGWKMWDLCV